MIRSRRVLLHVDAGRRVPLAREVFVLAKKWLPRGLSKGTDRFYIGLAADETRSERHGGIPGKLISTDEDFEIIDTVELEGAGQVNEVRLISEWDAAHNGVAF